MSNVKVGKSKQIDMLNGSLIDKILVFAIPIALSSILQQMFNAVDVAVVGRFASSTAQAAVGGNGALINLLLNLFIGISVGANVVIAKYIGQGRTNKIKGAVHTAMLIAVLSGIILLFLGISVAKPILELMGTPYDVIDQAVVYLRIYFAGMPFIMVYNFGASILRSIGDTKRPLMFLIVSGCINAVLNLILVIGFSLSVVGVAVATVISQMISCILVLRCLYKSEGSYQLRFSELKINKKYMIQIFQVGVPAGIQSTVINFSNVLLQSSVNSFGSVAMAGYTAANNILGFLYQSINSVTQACMSFTSQNYGVGKYKRMDRVLADCMILTVAVSLIIGCSAYFFGNYILRIYTSDAEVIKCGLEILSITTVPYFLCGIMDLFPGALRGMGYSAVPMILSVIGTVGMRVLWIYVVFPLNRSLYVLFISYPASWIITIILQVICYYFVRKQLYGKKIAQA